MFGNNREHFRAACLAMSGAFRFSLRAPSADTRDRIALVSVLPTVEQLRHVHRNVPDLPKMSIASGGGGGGSGKRKAASVDDDGAVGSDNYDGDSAAQTLVDMLQLGLGDGSPSSSSSSPSSSSSFSPSCEVRRGVAVATDVGAKKARGRRRRSSGPEGEVGSGSGEVVGEEDVEKSSGSDALAGASGFTAPWFFPSRSFQAFGEVGVALGYVTREPLLSLEESLEVARELLLVLGEKYLPRPTPKILGKRQSSPRHVAIVARPAAETPARGGGIDATHSPGGGVSASSASAEVPQYSYKHLPAREHPVLSLELLPTLENLLVRRAERLLGKQFNLAHISLYTDFDDKMGMHDDGANTRDQFVCNVSLLAPRVFVLGQAEVVTRSGHAIVFNKSARHGVRRASGALLAEQRMEVHYKHAATGEDRSGTIIMPRISVSLRVGASTDKHGQQQFLHALDDDIAPRTSAGDDDMLQAQRTTEPLMVRIGQHPFAELRRTRPRLCAGHLPSTPVGSAWIDRTSVNLEGILLTMQGAGDKKKEFGGLATAIMADVRRFAAAGHAQPAYTNRAVYLPTTRAPRFAGVEPPELLFYSAQCSGVVGEAIDVGQIRSALHCTASEQRMDIDFALLRSCAAASAVRVVARVDSASFVSLDARLEKGRALYSYWGLYVVAHLLGVRIPSSDGASDSVELRYFALLRVREPDDFIAPHEVACECPQQCAASQQAKRRKSTTNQPWPPKRVRCADVVESALCRSEAVVELAESHLGFTQEATRVICSAWNE